MRWLLITIIFFVFDKSCIAQNILIGTSCGENYIEVLKVCDACGELGTPVWRYSNLTDQGVEIAWRNSIGKWEIYFSNQNGEAYYVSQSNNRLEFPPCLEVGDWELNANWDYCDAPLELFRFEYDDGRCQKSIELSISCLPGPMIIPLICDDCGDLNTPGWNYGGDIGEIEIGFDNTEGRWYMFYSYDANFAVFTSMKGNASSFPPCLEVGNWELTSHAGLCNETAELEEFEYINGQCGKSIIFKMTCPPGEFVMARICDDCGVNGTPVWDVNNEDGEATLYWEEASNSWILNHVTSSVSGSVFSFQSNNHSDLPPCLNMGNWNILEYEGDCNEVEELLRLEYIDQSCSVIPTMTTWGLVILLLILMIMGSIGIRLVHKLSQITY